MAEPTSAGRTSFGDGGPQPHDIEPAPVFLTPAELAARWRTTVAHLNNLRFRRQGPDYVKTGDGKNSPVRYRLDDVEAYEKARTKACRRDLAGDG